MQMYDPSSKWMLEEHGASILYLAGQRNVLSCKARKAEVVQPRKLPDGLLEARMVGSTGSKLVLVEVATYPEERVVKQIQDDIRLVRQARGILPEALVLCLCKRGTYRIPEEATEQSTLGWTAETLRWKVVEAWTKSAEELLEAPNVAVALWATLRGTMDRPRCCFSAAVTESNVREGAEGEPARRGSGVRQAPIRQTGVVGNPRRKKDDYRDSPDSRDRRGIQAGKECGDHYPHLARKVWAGQSDNRRWSRPGEGKREAHEFVSPGRNVGESPGLRATPSCGIAAARGEIDAGETPVEEDSGVSVSQQGSQPLSRCLSEEVFQLAAATHVSSVSPRIRHRRRLSLEQRRIGSRLCVELALDGGEALAHVFLRRDQWQEAQMKGGGEQVA